MNNVITLEDGSIEYWSVLSVTHGLLFFDCPKAAVSYMDRANDGFLSGVNFHKEFNGKCLLKAD